MRELENVIERSVYEQGTGLQLASAQTSTPQAERPGTNASGLADLGVLISRRPSALVKSKVGGGSLRPA
jgi:hypothetical protein